VTILSQADGRRRFTIKNRIASAPATILRLAGECNERAGPTHFAIVLAHPAALEAFHKLVRLGANDRAKGAASGGLESAIAAARQVRQERLAQRVGMNWPAREFAAVASALAGHAALENDAAHLVLSDWPLPALVKVKFGPAPTNLAQEWRTPPLWGVADSAPYLHDGRAATLLEAIVLHGGEAKPCTERFLALPAGDRMAILEFLGCLKAP
jgi:hypothetical protein